MLLIFNYLLGKITSSKNALLFTAFLSLVPIVMIHAGGLTKGIGGLYTGDFVGYADLTLAIFFLCAAGFFCLYVYLEEKQALFLSILFFAMGVFTKNEGITFAFAGIILIGIYIAFIAGAKRPGTGFIVAMVISFLIIAMPWIIYSNHLNLTSEYSTTASFSTVVNNLGRLPIILKRVGSYLFLKTSLFNFTWYLYLATIILNWRGFFARPVLFLNILGLCQFSLYVFVYMISPADIEWHLGTSLDRLILHMTPLYIFIAAINFYKFKKSPPLVVEAKG